MKGLFITGTDTGVGKTEVCCALAASARRSGLCVAACKPVETGCRRGADGWQALDLARLTAHSDERVRQLLNSYCYEPPLAPSVAAELAGRAIELSLIVERVREAAGMVELCLVEGAGGLMVPLSSTETMADLAGELGFPVLVVARSGLGTINHSVLTVEALLQRGLRVAAVVLNDHSGAVSPDQPHNAASIRALIPESIPVLGPVAYSAGAPVDLPADVESWWSEFSGL